MIKKSLIALTIATTSITACTTSDKQPTTNPTTVAQTLQKNLADTGIQQEILSAEPTEIDNIYIVNADGIPPFFTDQTGRYVIQGQIMDIGNSVPIDIASKSISKKAKEKLANIDEKEMIIYPAKGETKATIYVFTDVDCPYCTQLHQEIDRTNELGIEVRYLAFPRMEMSLPKMQNIWCAENKKQAMDDAKSGKDISNIKTCESPVEKQIELGISLGVNGTPGIFTESGQKIGGYLPSEQLAKAAIENN